MTYLNLIQKVTKRIKNLMDEKTFKEMSCEVVTLLITDENRND